MAHDAGYSPVRIRTKPPWVSVPKMMSAEWRRQQPAAVSTGSMPPNDSRRDRWPAPMYKPFAGCRKADSVATPGVHVRLSGTGSRRHNGANDIGPLSKPDGMPVGGVGSSKWPGAARCQRRVNTLAAAADRGGRRHRRFRGCRRRLSRSRRMPRSRRRPACRPSTRNDRAGPADLS